MSKPDMDPDILAKIAIGIIEEAKALVVHYYAGEEIGDNMAALGTLLESAGIDMVKAHTAAQMTKRPLTTLQEVSQTLGAVYCILNDLSDNTPEDNNSMVELLACGELDFLMKHPNSLIMLQEALAHVAEKSRALQRFADFIDYLLSLAQALDASPGRRIDPVVPAEVLHDTIVSYEDQPPSDDDDEEEEDDDDEEEEYEYEDEE